MHISGKHGKERFCLTSFHAVRIERIPFVASVLSFLLSQIVLPHVATRQGVVPNHESFKVGQMKIVQNLSIYLSIHPSSYLPTYLPKTKQFCKTSPIFEVDNIKNEAILRHFIQKWKVECKADGLIPIHFAIFPLLVSKLLRLPRKSEGKSYEVLPPVTQNHLDLASLKI